MTLLARVESAAKPDRGGDEHDECALVEGDECDESSFGRRLHTHVE